MQKSMVKNSFSSTTDELKYKIIIVGDSSVGKSALFMKFTYGEVDDEVRTKVTMIDFKLKEVFVPEEI
jgi:GTPase SAR1 family protein